MGRHATLFQKLEIASAIRENIEASGDLYRYRDGVSDNSIASSFGVDRRVVGRVRAQLYPNFEKAPRTRDQSKIISDLERNVSELINEVDAIHRFLESQGINLDSHRSLRSA